MAVDQAAHDERHSEAVSSLRLSQLGRWRACHGGGGEGEQGRVRGAGADGQARGFLWADHLVLVVASLCAPLLPHSGGYREDVSRDICSFPALDRWLLLPARVVGGDPCRHSGHRDHYSRLHGSCGWHFHPRPRLISGSRQARAGRHGRFIIDRIQHLRHLGRLAHSVDHKDRHHRVRRSPGAHHLTILDVLCASSALHGLHDNCVDSHLRMDTQQAVGGEHGLAVRHVPPHCMQCRI
mmetsp:Transcript_99486/g.213124  ORF Transcript_99486/g.213124 Transcript_99486/m.213124 type:complete len:238 (+) Transcript_99486:1464-2177(+)